MEFQIITEEEQNANFEKCMNVLNNCNRLTELSQLGSAVYEQTNKNMHIMSKKQKDTFWDKYREKKESLSPQAA